jgi:hypothetical protein
VGVSQRHGFGWGCEDGYTTGNEGDGLLCTCPFSEKPIGPLPATTAKFEIVPGTLLGKNAAPGIGGVNKR